MIELIKRWRLRLEQLRRWLCRDRDDQQLALETPGTWALEHDVNQGLVVELTIRSTKQLHDRRGRIPEEMAAVYIAGALAQAGLGYRVELGFGPVALTTQQAACRTESEGGDARDVYEPVVGEWPESARDANLVLTDAQGGGCSLEAPPRAGCVGARALEERREWTSEGSDQWHSAVQAVLHELGHLLGAHHDHDQDQAGKQHPGMGWNDHQREVWQYTPTVFGNDVENRCGEMVPEREYSEGVRVHEFHDCAIALFEEELRTRQ